MGLGRHRHARGAGVRRRGADHHAGGDKPIRPSTRRSRGAARSWRRSVAERARLLRPSSRGRRGRSRATPGQPIAAFTPTDRYRRDRQPSARAPHRISAQLQLRATTATTRPPRADGGARRLPALNTIAAFIRTEPERARTGARVRRSPAQPPRASWRATLERSRGTSGYLDLEQARFGSQLGDGRRPPTHSLRPPPLLSSRWWRTRSSTARRIGRRTRRSRVCGGRLRDGA
jgi:hypothetical protein